MPSKSQSLRPRLCVLEKGDNGYGFHLHGEKGKTGQFIRLVEPDSPAEVSGLRAGDRLVFVNGEDVDNESHQRVVSPDTGHRGPPGARRGSDAEEEEEEEQRQERGGSPRETTPEPESDGEIHGLVGKKLSINSEKVNGVPVEGKTHSEVVAAIKSGGNETSLLVVDPDTDTFFKRLQSPLPEPVVNGEMEGQGKIEQQDMNIDCNNTNSYEDYLVNGRGTTEGVRDSKLSVSPSPSNASSNTSLTTPPANTPPEGFGPDAIPALNLSLQQVRDLAHQKRSNKRAPPMDWTKKNELFSNL
ncbi:unnamed protein product [Lampetra planeri]